MQSLENLARGRIIKIPHEADATVVLFDGVIVQAVLIAGGAAAGQQGDGADEAYAKTAAAPAPFPGHAPDSFAGPLCNGQSCCCGLSPGICGLPTNRVRVMAPPFRRAC